MCSLVEEVLCSCICLVLRLFLLPTCIWTSWFSGHSIQDRDTGRSQRYNTKIFKVEPSVWVALLNYPKEALINWRFLSSASALITMMAINGIFLTNEAPTFIWPLFSGVKDTHSTAESILSYLCTSL